MTISEDESDLAPGTTSGLHRSSLFHGYAPWMLGLLGTHERVHRQTYGPLERQAST